MAAKRRKIDREERRENILRPSPYLGYNWDELGLYFNDRDAEHLAEPQFRRAVWLNPYEPEFKIHLAECLYRRKQYVEAAQWIEEALKQKPDHLGAHNLKRWIQERSAIEAKNHQSKSSATP
jgi:tetratricopeptide (TPR) repeat protein